MDEFRLKISLAEARAIVDALHLRPMAGDLNPPVEWLKLARRIEARLVRHEYAYGNGADRLIKHLYERR